jgi:hypothetical protein
MSFASVLFGRPDDAPPNPSAVRMPECFPDLNLDQIVAAVTAGREEYELTPFFYRPLHDADAVTFRQEVMQDLEDPGLFADITAFAGRMRQVREHLAQLDQRYSEHQKERWFVDAVDVYGSAITALVGNLSRAALRSRGLLALRESLAAYAASEPFATLIAEARRLLAALAAIHYRVVIRGLRVEVHPDAGEPDYGAEVEATFARFQQGAAKEYAFSFSDALEMNAVEERILDGVASVHAQTFGELAAYRAAHAGFVDAGVAAFDREVQFYLAYLEHAAKLRTAGLGFCYPTVSDSDKDVYDEQGFDLALADKLLREGRTPVCNDFFLKAPERIIVVSGPNQGGKTTFARTVGQLHYLASLGCPVPGRRAALFLPDRIFTHFDREEHTTNLRGKLEDDLVRIHGILADSTPRSLVIINEIFASTALRDALALSKAIARAIVDLDALCVWVTFLDEIASLGDATVSMVSTVEPDDPARRTFRVIRRRADGVAYAMAIARKYRLTYDVIKERIGP